MMRTTSLFLLLAATLALAQRADAQTPRFSEPGKSYVKIDLDPGYAEELKRRLQMEDKLGPFKDLVKQILADPNQLGLDPGKLKDMKLEDPELKKALEEWVRSDPKLRESLRDWIRQNPQSKELAKDEQAQRQLQKLLDEASQKEPAPPLPVEWKPAEKLPRPKDDAFTKLTERAMKEAQNTQLGEFLQRSPAWQRAFEDLRGVMQQSDAPPGLFGDLPSKLLTPDGNTFKLADSAFSSLRDLPRPRFDRFRWDKSVPGIGQIPTPDFGTPGGPDFGDASLPSLGAAASWILVVLIVLLVGWRLMRFTRRTAPVVQDRPNLGPWPVRPEAVATRADLVLAFDYLALWTLGLGVKSWNHHAVANRWRTQAPACGDSAAALAQLYEQARYTLGADALPDAERELAQRSLAQIAEAL